MHSPSGLTWLGKAPVYHWDLDRLGTDRGQDKKQPTQVRTSEQVQIHKGGQVRVEGGHAGNKGACRLGDRSGRRAGYMVPMGLHC